MKKKKSDTPKEEIEEWDISADMGIFPKDIPFTQNIGCVGGRKKKTENKESESEGKS